jgi:hypothetical protein
VDSGVLLIGCFIKLGTEGNVFLCAAVCLEVDPPAAITNWPSWSVTCFLCQYILQVGIVGQYILQVEILGRCI